MGPAVAEPAPVTESSRWDYLLSTWRELDVPEGWRAEIVTDDAIMLGAPLEDAHCFIASRVCSELHQAISDDWGVYQALSIRLPLVGRLYVPDLVVMPEDVVLDRSQSPSPAEAAFLAVEIVSRSSMDTDRRKKLGGYACAEVPLYLLIDAWDGMGPSVSLHEQPSNGRYKHTSIVEFGEKIRLPEPFDLELDTSRFPGPDKWAS
ncbi:Uma2 family endonuclease [Nocardiopsis sp. EMB25]|nr:Uma2 family endonuclease [Nocardiopsis sp. EMB25]